MRIERNIITMNEYGRIHFPNTTSNNIWMSINELIDLFGIIYPTLRSNIKAIYKSGILDECKVQRCINISNGISIDVYALPMIIALSFRLNTLEAYKVRECVMNKLTAKPRKGILLLNARTHECMNESKYAHNQMRIDEGMMLYSNLPMCEIPIIRPFLYGYKVMCKPTLKSASSSGKPFSKQSSSHT